MSTNLEYRARERQRKIESGCRPAKLKEKKGDRDLEREIKKPKETFFLLEEQHANFVAAVTKCKCERPPTQGEDERQ